MCARVTGVRVPFCGSVLDECARSETPIIVFVLAQMSVFAFVCVCVSVCVCVCVCVRKGPVATPFEVCVFV